jgi:3'(2'), 5'-bisphosphate nucleotidase
MAYENEHQVAIDAVVKACRLCQAVQSALVSEETLAKDDRSPVTVADYGAQAVVALALQEAFPNDPLVAEETAAALREPGNESLRDRVLEQVEAVLPGKSGDDVLSAIDRGSHAGGAEGRFWTLDPIDGTKGFLRGDQYAVALALIDQGTPVLGVLGCPNLPLDPSQSDGPCGCLFHAVSGERAKLQAIGGKNVVAVVVSSVEDPAQARFCESVESGHSSHDDSARVAEALGVAAPPYRIDSQAKYAAVARGDASIYLRMPTSDDYQEKIWDHAAGWVVVREAGGDVTDIHGKPLDFSAGRTLQNNRGVVATNGALHAQVLKAIKQVVG